MPPVRNNYKEQYESLIAYFKTLVGWTYVAIAVVFAIAIGISFFIIGNSLDDVKQKASETVRETVKEETQKKVNDAFDKSNVDSLITKIAQREIDRLVEKTVKERFNELKGSQETDNTISAQIINAANAIKVGHPSGVRDLYRIINNKSINTTLRNSAQRELNNASEDLELEVLRSDTSVASIVAQLGYEPDNAPDNKIIIGKLVSGIQQYQTQTPSALAVYFFGLNKFTGQHFPMLDMQSVEKWAKQNPDKYSK